MSPNEACAPIGIENNNKLLCNIIFSPNPYGFRVVARNDTNSHPATRCGVQPVKEVGISVPEFSFTSHFMDSAP